MWIVEVALKVVPKPRLEATLRLELDETSALTQLNTWGGQPWPISASAWHDNRLQLRLSGSAAAVNAALARLPGKVMEGGAANANATR